ncbi:MAG: hypothetical protein EBR82_64885 [Caulobacteraceae bacterium]|nr:hypothetical protein [Caulobacteraceae bacterium]
MSLAALVVELAKPEYSGLSDQAAADAVNAKTVSVRELVPCWLVKQLAIESGYWAAIKIASQSSDVPLAVRGVALSAVDWIDDSSGKIQNVDMDSPAVMAMLSGLVAASLLTQSQSNDLRSLADQTKRWVDVVGIGTVGIGYVRNARGK